MLAKNAARTLTKGKKLSPKTKVDGVCRLLLHLCHKMPNGIINVLFQVLQSFQRINSTDKAPLRAMNPFISFCKEVKLAVPLPYTIPFTLPELGSSSLQMSVMSMWVSFCWQQRTIDIFDNSQIRYTHFVWACPDQLPMLSVQFDHFPVHVTAA